MEGPIFLSWRHCDSFSIESIEQDHLDLHDTVESISLASFSHFKVSSMSSKIDSILSDSKERIKMT